MIQWSVEGMNVRGKTWYVSAVIASLSLIFTGIIMQIYILAVIVLICAGIYLLQTNEGDTLYVEINEDGILIQNEFFPYSRISQFAIQYENTVGKSLRIYLGDTKFITETSVPFSQEVNSQEIREYLSQYIPEVACPEKTLAERCIEILRL